MKYSDAVRRALPDCIGPVLKEMGFTSLARLRWRRNQTIELRAIIDSKAMDAYRGGAFTLEVEVSAHRRFGDKLSGTARLEQLLTPDEQRSFLAVRNEISRRLPYPTSEHLRLIPDFVMNEYLRPFRPAEQLDPVFLLRFHSEEDLQIWCPVLRAALPAMIERASSLDPTIFVQGRHWE